MQKRRLGQSDLVISPVVLGAWAIGGSMWGGQDERRSIAAIQASIDAGIDLIDTAPNYGLGRSEEIVGKAIRGRRERVLIATKCGLIWDRPEGTPRFTMIDEHERPHAIHYDMRPRAVRRGCEDSLRRLGTDRIDLLQIHWPDPSMRMEDMFGEMLRLREEGLVRWLGVCNLDRPQLEVARAVGGIVSHQPQYSLLERGIEQEVLPWCRREDVGVIVYSPMARGLLTGKYGLEHKFPVTDHRAGVRWFQPDTLPRVLAALEKARPIASAYGVSLGNLAVAWTLAQPGVTAAIVGARDAAQAEENAKAASIRLSEADARALGEIFASEGTLRAR
jgi:aryl-alcohol dehydrogenase-like predicted oxidoreductase